MSRKLLLIEDNDALLELVSTIVTRQGYDVIEAADSDKALEMLEQTEFDVVVTDLMLKGLPGTDIIRKIKAKTPQTRIVAISGKGEQYLQQAVDAGADATVPKPFKIAEFVQALED